MVVEEQQRERIPLVVKVYVGLFATVLVFTIVVWGFDIALHYEGEHHLYEIFADAFKVMLGAVIGVMSHWASQVFGQQRV